MTRYKNIDGETFPYTEEEEAAQDAREVAWEEEKKIRDAKTSKIDELEAKLADDSITFTELKELMRFRG